MRRFIILFFIILILLSAIYWLKIYLINSVKETISEKRLSEFLDSINSSPTLDNKFKEIYKKVYPRVFDEDYSVQIIKGYFRDSYHECPCKQLAAQKLKEILPHKTNSNRSLILIGLVWILEESATQEKCFEYLMSKYDFLYNTKGINEASIFYFKKPLENLNNEEQLGLILKIKNPLLYDNQEHPDKYSQGVIDLKKKITEQKIKN